MQFSLPGTFLLVVAVADTVLFFYFLRYEKTITIKAYLAFISGVFFWVFGNAISYFSVNPDITFFQKLTYLGGTLLASSFLLFIHSFPYPRSRAIEKLRYLPFVVTIITAFFLFATNTVVKHTVLVQGRSFMMQTQPGLFIWSFVFIIIWTLAAYELIRRFRRETGDARNRLRYLTIGVSISLVVGIVTDVIVPLTSIQNFPWVGPGFSVVWLWFTVKAVRV